MDTQEVRLLIGKGNKTRIENYLAYLYSVETAKKKGVLANPWMKHKTPQFLARIYKAVEADNLVFDGIDVTLQSTGVSYSYQAFKNRMLSVYPESIIDVGLVYKEDGFKFEKQSGKITYYHDISNPFIQSDSDIIGGYCVIKNKRGEFLTTLTRADIDKHRRVAKTDFIWKTWFVEMAMKTLIKKACKTHFKDSFTTIENLDNDNYDLDNVNICITQEQVDELQKIINAKSVNVEALCNHFDVAALDKITPEEFPNILIGLKEKK